MLHSVEVLVVYERVSHLFRNINLVRGIRWPVLGSYDSDRDVGLVSVVMVQVLKEQVLEVLRSVHVFEHSLELIGERGSALCLQLAQHHLFSIHRSTSLEKQSLRQTSLVVCLEHVFPSHVAEQYNRVVNHLIQTPIVRHIFVATVKETVEVLGD